MKNTKYRILNDKFEFKLGNISFENGVFTKVTYEDSDITDDSMYEYTIIPGLVDIHIHGCAGEDVMTADFDGFDKMSRFMAENGTTAFFPTLLTAPMDDIEKAAKSASRAAQKGVRGASIPGVHLEGPYFGKECIGANNADYIKKPDVEEISNIQNETDNFIKIISMDPTLDGAIDFIKHFSKEIRISLGHTPCDFDTAQKAFAAGATNITHTFNGMKPMHHRNPNMLCAAFLGGAYMEIISDGFHVAPPMVKCAYKLAGGDRLVFITDMLSSAGAPEGIYDIGGCKTIVKDGKALLEDGTICGGMTPLYKCVMNAVGFGIPFCKAVKCASLNAAVAAGASDKYGSITVGKSADFVVLDKAYEIKEVYVRGEKVNGKQIF